MTTTSQHRPRSGKKAEGILVASPSPKSLCSNAPHITLRCATDLSRQVLEHLKVQWNHLVRLLLPADHAFEPLQCCSCGCRPFSDWGIGLSHRDGCSGQEAVVIEAHGRAVWSCFSNLLLSGKKKKEKCERQEIEKQNWESVKGRMILIAMEQDWRADDASRSRKIEALEWNLFRKSDMFDLFKISLWYEKIKLLKKTMKAIRNSKKQNPTKQQSSTICCRANFIC